MGPLCEYGLSSPVDQTWHSLREAVLAHPRISGARFEHDIKRVDLVTEKSVVGPRRRISAMVVDDADGARVVIAGVGKRGLSQQVATELLADVSHRLAAPAPEEASPAPLPAPAVSDDVWERRLLRAPRSVTPKRDDQEKPQVSRTDRTPRTPPAPPPPPSPAATPRPPAAPPRPPAAPPLASLPDEYELPAHDALSELAHLNDWSD